MRDPGDEVDKIRYVCGRHHCFDDGWGLRASQRHSVRPSGNLRQLESSKNRLFSKANRLLLDWGKRGIGDGEGTGIFRR